MLHDHRGGAVELERKQTRCREVGEVVERERLALELLDPRQDVRSRAALGVVRRALVRILPVRELEDPVEDRQVRLGKHLVLAEPAGDRGVERGGRLERAGRERAPGGGRDLCAETELLDEGLIVLGPADGHDVRVVLRRRAEEGRAADVDLLDRVLPVHVEAADGALERVEVDADEVDRRDPVGLELGEVVRHVPAGEDAAVHRWVERDDAMAEQLAEPRQLLERGHRDALGGERLRGAAACDQLDTELLELPRERDEAGLVVDGEQCPVDAHWPTFGWTLTPRSAPARRREAADARPPARVPAGSRRCRRARPRRARA